MSSKKKQRGTLYLPDGTVKLLIPKNGKQFTLREMQQAVGGYVEAVVPINKSTNLFANELGAYQDHPANVHTEDILDLSLYPKGTFLRGRVLSTYRVTAKEEEEQDKWRVTVDEALNRPN